MLQMSSKLSVSFSRPLARFAPLLSVAVSCWLPGSAVPSCVDGFSLTRCPRDISRTPRRFRTSVNQLSLYGAVADLMKELPVDQRAPGKLVALDQMEQEILTQLPFCRSASWWRRDRETYCKVTSKDLKNYQKTRSYPNCAPKQVWIWSKLDNSSMVFRSRVEWRIDLHAENTRYLEMKRKVLQKGGSKAVHNSVLSRT